MKLQNIFFRIIGHLGILKLKRVVFLHLQKTAGTSIVNVARQFYGNKNIVSHGDYLLAINKLNGSNDKDLKQNQIKFEEIPFISGHFGYGFAKQFMANRYSFIFLRDPVERLLSFYYYSRTRDPNKFEHYAKAQQLSLDDFLELRFTDPSIMSHVWNHQVSQLAVGWGGGSDSGLSDNDLLEMAIKHLDDFSYVGFTETYERDQANILKAIGITIPVGNQKSNANPGRPMFDGLPQSSKDLLLELTVLDRQLYETAWAKYNSN